MQLIASCLLFSVRPHAHVSLTSTGFTRNNVIQPHMSLAERRCVWTQVNETMSALVVHKYFGATPKSLTCDVFLIEGVPAACVLYRRNHTEVTVIDEIHVNKAMLLMFDAGPIMRTLLHKRHKHVDLSNSINRDEFLLI